MSPSSPVRTRQPRRPPPPPPQTASRRSPRGEAVVRSVLLIVAAVAVIATSDYLAYLVGRKQVTYEEMRRQVDRLVNLVDRKHVEEEHAITTLKERQERLEQGESVLNGLTTGTVNGKTTAVPEPMPAGKAIVTPLLVDTAPAPAIRDVGMQPPEQPQSSATKHRDVRAVAAHPRAPRRQKAPAPAVAGAAGSSFAQQPTGQGAAAPAPDAGLANQ